MQLDHPLLPSARGILHPACGPRHMSPPLPPSAGAAPPGDAVLPCAQRAGGPGAHLLLQQHRKPQGGGSACCSVFVYCLTCLAASFGQQRLCATEAGSVRAGSQSVAPQTRSYRLHALQINTMLRVALQLVGLGAVYCRWVDLGEYRDGLLDAVLSAILRCRRLCYGFHIFTVHCELKLHLSQCNHA